LASDLTAALVYSLFVAGFYAVLVWPKKVVAPESRVDARLAMDYPVVMIGDFGCVTLVYDGFLRTEWLLDDPFDSLRELGLIGGESPSPKLDDTGEAE
jgi:hypothetical protein